jgi:hypothetical protein
VDPRPSADDPRLPGNRPGHPELDPGTRSLWGAAIEFNVKSPKSNPKLLILKYGG